MAKHRPVTEGAQRRSVVDVGASGYVRVRGAREHNLKNADVDIPRNALVVVHDAVGMGYRRGGAASGTSERCRQPHGAISATGIRIDQCSTYLWTPPVLQGKD